MKFWQGVLAATIGTIAGLAGVLLFIWLRYLEPLYAAVMEWWGSPIDEPIDIETALQAALGRDYILLWILIAAAFLIEGAFIAWGVNRRRPE